MSGGRTEGMTLLDYLNVLARHKLLVGVVTLLVPAAALYFTLGQQPRFEATAEVLLSRQDLASALTSVPNPNGDILPERFTSTQARLARVPEVAQRAVAEAGVADRTAEDLLESSTVSGDATTDILVFTVTDSDAAVAIALAEAYAVQFTEYRHELETASLGAARTEVDERLTELRAVGSKRSRLYKNLLEKRRELEVLEALQTASSSVIQRPAEAEQTRPRPLRALAFAVPLGILLAVALAVVTHLLDTRVWSAPEIAQRLKLRLLGRVPDLPRRFRPRDRLIMLNRPGSPRAGVFRVLRANLELANRTHAASTIMFTSARSDEGKSTTVANLAVALARAGKDIVLIDLNFHKPAIESLFRLRAREGVTDVLAGAVEFERAVQDLPFRSTQSSRRAKAAASGFEMGGRLRVLPAGTLSGALADVAGTAAVSDVLDRAKHAADVVLIDTPPLLDGADAIALSAQVEAVVLVTRARKARRAVLGEVRRLLAGSPAVKLGVVVTAADVDTDGVDEAYAPMDETPLESRAA